MLRLIFTHNIKQVRKLDKYVFRHLNVSYAGPAVIRLKEKSAQSEQGKAQLELALSAQTKHSRAVEAELASANARVRQLEVRLHYDLSMMLLGSLPA